MTQREQDSSGDYGYDLVHEEIRRTTPAEPPGRSAGAHDDRPAPASGPDEMSADLSYDEAHGF